MEQCLISETCHFRFRRKKITLRNILQHVQELQYFVVAKQYMHFVDKLFILEGLCHEVNIFLGPIKLNQFCLNMHWWFLNFLCVFIAKKFKYQVFTCFFTNAY